MKKNKNVELGLVICCFSIYFFPYILRSHYISFLGSFNFLFWIGMFILYNFKIFKSPLRSKMPLNILFGWFIMLISILIIFIAKNNTSIESKLTILLIQILPMFLIYSDIGERGFKYRDKVLNYWYSSIKYICYLTIIFWLCDKFLNNFIQKFFIGFYNIRSMTLMAQYGRYVSFFGNSLTLAVLMFSFLLWTLILNHQKIYTKRFLFNISISILGIATSGSKSGLICAIVTLLIFFTTKENFRKVILLVIILGIAYYYGLFDVTIERLMEGISKGDITTGRNTSLIKLINDGTMNFYLLKGQIINSGNTNIIAALEYPILRWAYRDGIIFAFCMSIAYIVRPIIKLIRKKKIRIILGCIIYIVLINTQDGISSYGDALLIYSTNIMLIIYSCCRKEDVINEKNQKNVS